MTRLLSALLLCLALAAPARALDKNTGTTAGEFLRLGAGARALGMGEASTAVADGPDAVYWNPAGLGRMSRPEASYTRSELPDGVHHDFLAFAYPSEYFKGTLAFAFTHFSEDRLALVNNVNQTVGSFAPHAEVYAFAYGRTFGDNDVTTTSRDYFRDNWNIPRADRPFDDEPEPWTGEISVGASVKAISETLGTRSASTFAIDGGGVYRPSWLHELIVAGAIRNMGEKMRYITEAEPLPVEGAASAAYDLRGDDWRLLPAVEADAPYAGQFYGKLGVEATKELSRGTSAALRAGYTSRTVQALGPLSGLTAGVGLRLGGFKFDAAFQPMTILGEAFRLSAGWKF